MIFPRYKGEESYFQVLVQGKMPENLERSSPNLTQTIFCSPPPAPSSRLPVMQKTVHTKATTARVRILFQSLDPLVPQWSVHFSKL